MIAAFALTSYPQRFRASAHPLAKKHRNLIQYKPMKTKTRVEFTRSHARGQVNAWCDTCKGGRMKCPGRTVKKMSMSTSVDTRQNYKTQITTPGLMPGGVIMQNIQQWKQNRKAEAERKAAYMANLKLPFAAEYGEHKAKKGDIYAIVGHTERFNSESPFCVKFYTVKKSFGRLCAYECDAQGNIIKQHGRGIVGNKYRGYRKTA